MRKTIKQRKRACCEFCKKDIKKNLSYYRDGKYYCNRNHYKKLKKKLKEDGKNNYCIDCGIEITGKTHCQKCYLKNHNPMDNIKLRYEVGKTIRFDK